MKHFFAPVLALCFIAVFILSFFKISLSSQRRIYWSCALFGAVSGFLMFLPNWKDGTVAALFALIPMTLFAYGYTSYIKIRGKIYALYLSDSLAEHDKTPAAAVAGQDYDPAPDSYGGIATAAKLWWVLIILIGMSVVLLYTFARGETDGLGGAIGAGILVFIAVPAGIGDASWDYPIARGQRLQFVIASVITAGAFTVLYLAAYHIGKQRPLRMKRSLEYRAHPRHRKNYPQ
jgi:hypothetical protein